MSNAAPEFQGAPKVIGEHDSPPAGCEESFDLRR